MSLARHLDARVGHDLPSDVIHQWFGLSYANLLVIPRSLLQSMPDEWQRDLVRLLAELEDRFDGSPDYEEPHAYRVQPVDEVGRMLPWSSVRVPHYNRGRTYVRPREGVEE